MIEKAVITAAVGAFCASQIVMADDTSLQFTVEAEIPTAQFHVTPVANWAGDVQRMGWNIANEELVPIQCQLDLKSTIGSVRVLESLL